MFCRIMHEVQERIERKRSADDLHHCVGGVGILQTLVCMWVGRGG